MFEFNHIPRLFNKYYEGDSSFVESSKQRDSSFVESRTPRDSSFVESSKQRDSSFVESRTPRDSSSSFQKDEGKEMEESEFPLFSFVKRKKIPFLIKISSYHDASTNAKVIHFLIKEGINIRISKDYGRILRQSLKTFFTEEEIQQIIIPS